MTDYKKINKKWTILYALWRYLTKDYYTLQASIKGIFTVVVVDWAEIMEISTSLVQTPLILIAFLYGQGYEFLQI